jgi:hypothetical protein
MQRSQQYRSKEQELQEAAKTMTRSKLITALKMVDERDDQETLFEIMKPYLPFEVETLDDLID